jgi:hypothetical protein
LLRGKHWKPVMPVAICPIAGVLSSLLGRKSPVC